MPELHLLEHPLSRYSSLKGVDYDTIRYDMTLLSVHSEIYFAIKAAPQKTQTYSTNKQLTIIQTHPKTHTSHM